MVMLRRRRGSDGKKPENSQPPSDENKEERSDESKEKSDSNFENLNLRLKSAKKSRKKWSCVDSCCWFIGCICSMWWFLLFLYNAMPASLPQYVTEAITGPLADPPGVKLAKEGLKAKHPVVFVPGIVTGGLELWEGHSCAEGLFRKRLWGGTFGEVYKRPLCWVEHMSLNNETGLDPPGIKIRPVSGLVAADYFAPGYFVWAVLIANLARIGYEDKNMFMAAYDWRLSFQNTEVRDQTLSRIKSNIELMVATSGGKKVVVVPHSMGALYFLHFMKWVEAPAPMGGGGGPNWCAEHIKAVMNIGGPFLGLPKVLTALFSAEARDIAIARAIAPGILDKDVFGFQTLQHVMRMTRTWDSAMSLLPRGGETIWGGLDWSPEEGHECNSKKKNGNGQTSHNRTLDLANFSRVKYGRILSFGKDVAQLHSSEIERVEFRGAIKGSNLATLANTTCRDIDASAEGGGEGHCLKGGVYSVDGDETVPVLSAGFTSAKIWRGKTRFNPSGIGNFIREYNHAGPTTLLEGRGTQSGAHVDILGNFALIEDIIRVAAGTTTLLDDLHGSVGNSQHSERWLKKHIFASVHAESERNLGCGIPVPVKLRLPRHLTMAAIAAQKKSYRMLKPGTKESIRL
ncbi:hypothetical protein DH2020_026615 [Rehmannia glutinosa]|uniref:Phospholipid:diacylglycerol acyltransferase n=1 Tax=Rehmannia glutinosa TaxID=99300 RepID=A0ABR0VZB9_REHGL